MTAMAVTKSTQMWLSCFIYQIWVVGDDVAVIDVGVDCFVFAVFAPDCGSVAVVKEARIRLYPSHLCEVLRVMLLAVFLVCFCLLSCKVRMGCVFHISCERCI